MTVQLDIGGGQITEANMAAAQKVGASRIHVVVGDLNTHKAELDLIHKYGMEGVLDVEIPLWVNIGMNTGADISWVGPQLQACQQAGWPYFSEEGGGRSQIDVIRAGDRKFINYGSENGANMYFGQYNHAADAHTENLIEWYHQYGINDGSYMATAKDSYAKCKVFGLTLMMYDTGDLYRPSIEPLKKSLDQLGAAGIPVSIVHMWSGQDVGAAFREPWVSVINFLKSYYGGFANATIPVTDDKEAQLNMWVVDQQVDVSVDVAMGGRLQDADGTPIAGQSVEVMHYVNYDTGRTLVQDGEKKTDEKGEVWYWFHGTRHYVLSYYLHFVAANGYKERWAGPLDIYVHQPRAD